MDVLIFATSKQWMWFIWDIKAMPVYWMFYQLKIEFLILLQWSESWNDGSQVCFWNHRLFCKVSFISCHLIIIILQGLFHKLSYPYHHYWRKVATTRNESVWNQTEGATTMFWDRWPWEISWLMWKMPSRLVFPTYIHISIYNTQKCMYKCTYDIQTSNIARIANAVQCHS